MPFFRRLRIVLWIVGFIALTVFLVEYTPWHTVIKPDYSALARTGSPIVTAIYKFRNDHGLWPEYLADLAPDYLPKSPDSLEWYYDTNTPQPQLRQQVGKTGTYVGYDFDPTSEGWKAWGTFLTLTSLPVTQDVPPAPKLDPVEVARHGIAELDRRIAREPMIMEHYQTKVALLRQLNQTQQVIDLLTTLTAKRPLYFWPHMALAVLEAQSVLNMPALDIRPPLESAIGHPFTFLAPLPTPATAPASGTATVRERQADLATEPAPVPHTYGEKFVAWVEAHPSFANYYFLHTYAKLVGDDTAAMLAAQKALKWPLNPAGPALPGPGGILIDTNTSMDLYTPEYYAFRIAAYLYQHGKHQDVINLTNQWESVPKAEMSFYAFRAASELALGQFDSAKGDIERASIANDRKPLWAKNLPALGNAIVNDKNPKFIYDPGARKPYDVFAPAEQ